MPGHLVLVAPTERYINVLFMINAYALGLPLSRDVLFCLLSDVLVTNLAAQ